MKTINLVWSHLLFLNENENNGWALVQKSGMPVNTSDSSLTTIFYKWVRPFKLLTVVLATFATELNTAYWLPDYLAILSPFLLTFKYEIKAVKWDTSHWHCIFIDPKNIQLAFDIFLLNLINAQRMKITLILVRFFGFHRYQYFNKKSCR